MDKVIVTITDDKPLAAEAVEAAGIRIMQRDGVWYAGDAGAQAIIDAHDSLPVLKTRKVAAVKAEARRRILALYPEWKQANLAARGTELVNLRTQRAWTPTEQEEADAMQSAWDAIKAIRTASDRIEAEIQASSDWRAVAACDVIATSRWPE